MSNTPFSAQEEIADQQQQQEQLQAIQHQVAEQEQPQQPVTFVVGDGGQCSALNSLGLNTRPTSNKSFDDFDPTLQSLYTEALNTKLDHEAPQSSAEGGSVFLPCHFGYEDVTYATDASSSGLQSVSSSTTRSHESCQIPSLKELRALEDPHDNASQLKDGLEGNDYKAVMPGLYPFVSSIFATQAQINGISSAIAQYLAWVRKGLPGSSQETLQTKWVPVLQILETRTRELHHLSKTNHWMSLKRLQESIESVESVRVEFSRLYTELLEQTATKDNFFRDNYNISMDLTEQ